MALHLLIEHFQHILALYKHLKPYFLLRVSQNPVQTLHLAQLRLFGLVASPFELPDGLIQEGDKVLHGGELSLVGVHPETAWLVTRFYESKLSGNLCNKGISGK